MVAGIRALKNFQRPIITFNITCVPNWMTNISKRAAALWHEISTDGTPTQQRIERTVGYVPNGAAMGLIMIAALGNAVAHGETLKRRIDPFQMSAYTQMLESERRAAGWRPGAAMQTGNRPGTLVINAHSARVLT